MSVTLAELLDAKLSGGMEPLNPREVTIEDLIRPGLSPTAARTELAELLSGVTGPGKSKAKAYRAARRNVERWEKTGRQPSIPQRLQLVAVRSEQDERISAMRVHGADMRILVSWYGERKREWLPPAHSAFGSYIHIRAFAMRTVIRLWSRGNVLDAAALLFQEFVSFPGAGYGYEVPNPQDWMRDVVVVDLDIEPAVS